jgi:hypothetical protein
MADRKRRVRVRGLRLLPTRIDWSPFRPSTTKASLPVSPGGTWDLDKRGAMNDEVSKAGMYRTRALECRKLAGINGPGAGAQYLRLAIAYEQLAAELERLGPSDALRWITTPDKAAE